MVLCAIVFCVSARSAWGQADENAKLVEGAKKESKLVWYTSTNVTEAKPLLDDFEKVYPFVKGEIGRRKPRASSRSSKIPTAPGRRSTLTMQPSATIRPWSAKKRRPNNGKICSIRNGKVSLPMFVIPGELAIASATRNPGDVGPGFPSAWEMTQSGRSLS